MSGARRGVHLLRWLCPLPDGYAEAGPSLDELKPEFRKWYLWGLPLFFAMAVPFTFAWWLALHRLAIWNDRFYQPSDFDLYDANMLVMFPAFFLGVGCSGLFLMRLYRRMLRDRYVLFERYENLVSGIYQQRLARPLIVIIVGLSLLGTLPALSWHVVFNQDSVTVHSWCGLNTKTELYSDLTEIRTTPQLRAPNGNLVDRREYQLWFRDGTKWSTSWEPSNLSGPQKLRLIEFVSQRAHKPIQGSL